MVSTLLLVGISLCSKEDYWSPRRILVSSVLSAAEACKQEQMALSHTYSRQLCGSVVAFLLVIV